MMTSWGQTSRTGEWHKHCSYWAFSLTAWISNFIKLQFCMEMEFQIWNKPGVIRKARARQFGSLVPFVGKDLKILLLNWAALGHLQNHSQELPFCFRFTLFSPCDLGHIAIVVILPFFLPLGCSLNSPLLSTLYLQGMVLAAMMCEMLSRGEKEFVHFRMSMSM